MYNDVDFELFLKALSFATKQHSGQVRKGGLGIPYINHPVEVTRVLYELGDVRDMDLLCAALLHDVVEDTETTKEDLEREFGKEIAGIVEEVSDPHELDTLAARKRQIIIAPKLSYSAKLLRLVDKICNVKDIGESPPLWQNGRRLEYIAWATQVVEALKPVNTTLENLFEKVKREALEKINGQVI